MFLTQDPRLFSHRIPGWIQQAPDYILASDDLVDAYAHAHGLALPDLTLVRAERAQRAAGVNLFRGQRVRD